MPKTVKAYSCGFGCGRNVTTKKSTIIKHEKFCKKNPGVRTCPTCKFEEYTSGDRHIPYEYQTGEYQGWLCKIDKLPENKMMVINCNFWEKK